MSTMVIPKVTEAAFRQSVHRVEQLPPAQYPEVAFLGRSNVGKSSLINALLRRRHLVRTSARPGCTRALNFFLVNGRWYFVDLPGFGYAAVSQELRENWGQLITAYLEGRDNLAAVVFLLDGRRLLGPEELYLWERLRSRQRRVIPVLTKADKLKPGARARQLPQIVAALAPVGVRSPDFLWFSALTHEGRDQLWRRLLECLG